MSMIGRTKWRLPPELDSIIIDYLFADKPTLSSCSLVCTRWLPRSRKHLFRAVTIRPSMDRSSHGLAEFLQTLTRSGDGNPGWAIGAYIKELLINPISSLVCSLSFLRALLSGLPQLASLELTQLVVLDDLSQEANPSQSEHARFTLEKLFISDCIAQASDLKHMLALVCLFSSIGELAMMNLEQFAQTDPSMFYPAAFTFPIIQSLDVNSVTNFHVMGVFYTLLADSPSVKNGHLTRIVLAVWSEEELSVFSDFAQIAGPAFREVDLYIYMELIDDFDVFRAWSLPICPALRSLKLCIEFPSEVYLNAENDRWTLSTHTEVLQRHRDAFPALTDIRLEIMPGGQQVADALIHCAALDGNHEQHGDTAENLAEDVWEDEAMWASLEDVLRGFPALEHVEFVCMGYIMEETKAELRYALERRLPRLWWSGVAQLVVVGSC